MATASLFAVDFATFEPGFNQFVADLATGGPFNATIGQTWSSTPGSATFGIGLTVGATAIPAAAVTTMANALGITLPSEFSYLETYGVPVPSYTLDARIGGLGPLDIGVKVGYVPASLMAGMPVTADFLVAGGDVRLALLQDKGLIPGLSVGVGYTFLQEAISVTGLMPGGISVANVYDGSTNHSLTLADPSLGMSVQTSVVEAKLQLSKQILFLTPYVGAAAMYSFGSSASGSVQSALLLDGSPITAQQISDITAYYQSQGQTPPDMSSTGFTASTSVDGGFSYRAYGGVSLNLLMLVVDLNASYHVSDLANLAGGALGVTANVRIAL